MQLSRGHKRQMVQMRQIKNAVKKQGQMKRQKNHQIELENLQTDGQTKKLNKAPMKMSRADGEADGQTDE